MTVDNVKVKFQLEKQLLRLKKKKKKMLRYVTHNLALDGLLEHDNEPSGSIKVWESV
jgi:hypothetical protein